MQPIILDMARPCNTSAEPDVMVVHGPTWAVTYTWDEDARDLKDVIEREGNWKERRRGSVLHMIPPVLAGD